MQTPDGLWRIEAVRRGATRWYRIVQGENVIDWLPIATLQRVLEEAGVDMATRIEVREDEPGDQLASGAA